jgi:regulator of protease activity HflC (stomatin/prohibitin superfamily)
MEYNYNECTTQALEAEQARVAEQHKALTAELNRRRQEEADRKKAQLALEKKQREDEIRAAGDHYNELVQAFVKDYGSYENFWGWFFKR